MDRRDHRPDPDHEPDPVYCLDCDEELKRVWDERQKKHYWRHKRRRQ
jgi:hypothetical protein